VQDNIRSVESRAAAAGTGEAEEVRAAMAWRLAIALEVLAERKRWPDQIAGFARPA
jgi:hypothetical protein